MAASRAQYAAGSDPETPGEIASEDMLPGGRPEHGTSMVSAFEQIRELIVHGRLAPGSWIVEAELAQRLHMSRTPVRGALHWLQREGYVTEHRNISKSRMQVSPLTREDSRELYRIIGGLEGMAGRGLAALPGAGRQQLVQLLRDQNDRLRQIAEGRGGSPADIFELDREFHRLIVQRGAGPRLEKLLRAVEPQAERYWRLYASSIVQDLRLPVAEHEQIVQAIERGQEDEIAAGLEENWRQGAERLGRVIDIFGERGSW